MLEAGFHPQLDYCNLIIERICSTYHITKPSIKDIFLSRGDRNIVYTSQEFNADEGVLVPDYIFVGPSANHNRTDNDLDLSVAGDNPVIYIALGSVNTDFEEFYKMCIEVLGNSDYFVYMSIGKKCNIDNFHNIPNNFVVRTHMPQLAILEHANVFITHAGFNSVNEALYYGVPMLALPMVNDQHMVAKRLSALGLGLTENFKELTPKVLKSDICSLMMEKEFKENCTTMSEQMHHTCQPVDAVKQLEDYVVKKRG